MHEDWHLRLSKSAGMAMPVFDPGDGAQVYLHTGIPVSFSSIMP